MAYETKVLLIAIADYIKAVKKNHNSADATEALCEVYKHVAKMANSDGVVLESFDE